jgi:hypothetical protein
VLGQINNQALVVKFAREWRHARITFEGTFAKIKINSYSCSWSIKKTTFKDKIAPLNS